MPAATWTTTGGYYPTAAQQTGRNVYNGDLVVEPGDVVQGDAIVYDGNVTVRAEGRVAGDVIVYSGNADIESGGAVDGDVAAFNGDVRVAGRVAGDIASWSGDVDIASSGHVGGDISVLSGEVTQQDGATIAGTIVRGPSFRLPLTPGRPFLFDIGPKIPGSVDVTYVQPSLWERLGRLMVRIVGAGLLAILLGVLAGALVYVRPALIDDTYGVLQSQTAMSFVVGLLSNLVLLFLGVLLTLTLCLIPVALLPFLLLFAVNLVGITALSRTFGERLARYFDYRADPAVYAGIGMLFFFGLIGLLFAFGTCFQIIGGVILLFVGSLGSGGVLLPWVRKYGMQAGIEDAQPVQSEPDAVDDAPVADRVDVAVPPPLDLPDDPTDEPTQPPGGPTPVVTPDDFTRIKGIGPVFDRRLKEANISTFAQLAAMPAEEIADIIGWPAERVMRSGITDQANELAGA